MVNGHKNNVTKFSIMNACKSGFGDLNRTRIVVESADRKRDMVRRENGVCNGQSVTNSGGSTYLATSYRPGVGAILIDQPTITAPFNPKFDNSLSEVYYSKEPFLYWKGCGRCER